MKIFNFLVAIIDRSRKRRMLNELQFMSHRNLIDCGFEPELLQEGIKAWPWRKSPESVTPLQFDQTLNLRTESNNQKLSAKLNKKQILPQQDAA